VVIGTFHLVYKKVAWGKEKTRHFGLSKLVQTKHQHTMYSLVMGDGVSHLRACNNTLMCRNPTNIPMHIDVSSY